MRNVFFISILLLSFNGNAQEWSPIGATWYYTYCGSSFSIFESVADTLINGTSCRKIQKSKSYYEWGERPIREYTYYSNDSVYFYDEIYSEFQLLYDFGASPGEFWYYRFPGYSYLGDVDTIKTVVDSIDFVTINSQILKRLYVHYDSVGFDATLGNSAWWNWNSVIIEYIGDTLNMFNVFTMDEIIFDGCIAGYLRCYDDSFIGHYETGIVDSCNYVNLLSVEENQTTSFEIYPNPATNQLTIKGKCDNYKIYTADGRMVQSGKLDNDNSLPVRDLESGMYFLVVENQNFSFETIRFVKE